MTQEDVTKIVTAVNEKAKSTDVYTKTEVDVKIQSAGVDAKTLALIYAGL